MATIRVERLGVFLVEAKDGCVLLHRLRLVGTHVSLLCVSEGRLATDLGDEFALPVHLVSVGGL